MITLPNGKICMNEQEAIQWLLDNNALPFQSSANYLANTEIGLGTIVNPSPAKVRIGSLIFFADSKVSTVIGLTENGFICSDKYNNLVDDVAYVTNVAINASGHLITTMSDGQTIDAGLIKQIVSFSINGSQHLIVTYNDGSTSDLGAIFNGNVTISGNLTVTGDATGPKADFNLVTGDEVVEKMSGYSIQKNTSVLPSEAILEYIYVGVVKNGNKLTFALAVNVTIPTGSTLTDLSLGFVFCPAEVMSKLYETNIGGSDVLSARVIGAFPNTYSNDQVRSICEKFSASVKYTLNGMQDLTKDTKYFIRVEDTFLLSDNLAA